MILLAATAVTLLAVSAPAFADSATVTTGGSVPAVCKVTATQVNVDVTIHTQQRISDLTVKCNDLTPVLSVKATNGNLVAGSGPSAFSVAYTAGVDLNGPINSLQTAQYTGAQLKTGQSFNLTPGSELAGGVPGDMTMIVTGNAWAAGNYTETFTLSIG